jgi:hypothetical protein
MSGPLRYVRPNIFVLAIGGTGVGKDSSLKRIFEPFDKFEQGLQAKSEAMKIATAADIAILELEYDRHKKSAAKAVGADRASFARLAVEANEKIAEWKKRLVQPCLSVSDVTKEALGPIMFEQIGEAVASISSEARGIVDVLCGRYSDNGSSDEDIYTGGYSGTPTKVNRVSRDRIHLREPCLALLWMLQPDKFYSRIGKENITESGLPQRFLMHDTHAEPQKIPDKREAVNYDVFDKWDDCVRNLLARYRLRQDPAEITPTPEAQKLLDAFFNELIDRRRTGGDLNDVNGYAARWCENAWRISAIWHAINEGDNAPAKQLSDKTAAAAIELVRWFAQEQLALLTGMRSRQRQVRIDKLSALLVSLPDGRSTLRVLRDSHGFNEAEVRVLAAEFTHRIEILELKPKTGRPSEVVILKR